VGMMGDGPTMGRPAEARLLMGSFDPVSLDTAAAGIMGFPFRKIPMLKWSERTGAGSMDFEIIGDPIDSFKLDFDKPRIAQMGPVVHALDWLTRGIFPQLRKRSKIIVDVDKCSLCGSCVEMCPFDAVKIENKAITISREKCNLCLCCMESCSNRAMDFKGILSHTDAFLH
jgi:NAD-dependent dihydropyrimidine dehydrogenase PreA subunit